MKVLLAPNSFKESASATQVCHYLEIGLLSELPGLSIKKIPLADGGDGTLEFFQSTRKSRVIHIQSWDPLQRPIHVPILVLDDGSVVVEMAQVSGLRLLAKEERKPLNTTTYGLGIILRYLIDKGYSQIILGIGGSATIDGGAGMAAALGYLHLNSQNENIIPMGGNLLTIERILPPPNNPFYGHTVRIKVLCDVTNPLCGPHGAAHVFGPQKGATPDEILLCDRGLDHLRSIWKRDLGLELKDLSGGGAAGGLGAGAVAYLNAEITNGAEQIIAKTHLKRYIRETSLVITGEGCLDKTTLLGKLPGRVAGISKEYGVPCVGITGKYLPEMNHDLLRHGFSSVIPLSYHVPQQGTINDIGNYLQRVGRWIGNQLRFLGAEPSRWLVDYDR